MHQNDFFNSYLIPINKGYSRNFNFKISKLKMSENSYKKEENTLFVANTARQSTFIRLETGMCEENKKTEWVLKHSAGYWGQIETEQSKIARQDWILRNTGGLWSFSSG
jgi:hypothetical protein